MRHRPSREHVALSVIVILSSAAFTACTADPEPLSTSALRLEFPDHAAEVLETPLAFAATTQGFGLAAKASAGTPLLRVELPRRGDGSIRIEGQKGFSIQVHEIGSLGEGQLAGNAVAYRRAGGTSYWTAAASGVEEWLHLEAGLATAGNPVATWVIDGATVVQSGDAVVLRDSAGAARIVVSAPVAYAASGRRVPARLAAHDARIELTVDGGGEAVLVDPLWTNAPSLTERRVNHTITRLANGAVLITGGTNYNAVGTTDLAIATTELRDPVTGAWATEAPMSGPRAAHSATLLGNGKVLVVGGTTSGNETGVLATAELYDPVAHAWSAAAPNPDGGRYGQVAQAFGPGNAQVLFTGGLDMNEKAVASAEIYDSTMGTWSTAPSMKTARYLSQMTRLADGKILVTGGKNLTVLSIAACEIYDPVKKSWSDAAPMHTSRFGHTATLLANGKVLVTAGTNQTDPVLAGDLKTSELYDPLMDTWTYQGQLARQYAHNTATLLSNGGVLMVGDDAFDPNVAEIYDPGNGLWAPGGALTVARANHTAVRLDDGSVLVAGGVSAQDAKICEVYTLGAPGSPCTASVQCESANCVAGACSSMPGSTSSAGSSGAGGSAGTSATTGGAGGSGGGGAAAVTSSGAGGAAPAGPDIPPATCSVNGSLGGSSSSSSAP